MYEHPTAPSGYCECGCGGKTTVSPKTCTAKGYVKGEPRRFLPGHWAIWNGREVLRAFTPVGDPTSCWEWAGRRNDRGYGTVGKRLAHRLAYEHANGRLPPGLLVCHKCDNPPCVNPAHLWLGTNQDNMHDMARKGRAARPRAIINERIVRTIRARCRDGESYSDVAASLGLKVTTVGKVARRERRANVA